jgi:hypothetical protein
MVRLRREGRHNRRGAGRPLGASGERHECGPSRHVGAPLHGASPSPDFKFAGACLLFCRPEICRKLRKKLPCALLKSATNRGDISETPVCWHFTLPALRQDRGEGLHTLPKGLRFRVVVAICCDRFVFWEHPSFWPYCRACQGTDRHRQIFPLDRCYRNFRSCVPV